MFVPYTAHSELAARLRDNEEKIKGMTGYKLKIVEKGGTMLHEANPVEERDAYSTSQSRGKGRIIARTA